MLVTRGKSHHQPLARPDHGGLNLGFPQNK